MTKRHLLMALAVPIIWGMGLVFAKAAIGHFPPILLTAFRFAVTALALVWFVKPPWPLMRPIIAISFVSAAIQYSLTFTGLKYLDASITVLIIQLEVPILVLLGALLLRERPGLQKLLGIALSVCGVILITGDPSLGDDYLAIVMVLGGVLTWALGQVMVRKLGNVGSFTLIAWVAVFATPQLFLASWLFETDQIRLIREADWVVWGTVVYLGLVMTALGYGIWYHLLGNYPVSQAGPFLLLIPVTTVAGGVLFLGETLTLMVALGGGVVIAGVAVIMFERRRPAPTCAPASVP